MQCEHLLAEMAFGSSVSDRRLVVKCVEGNSVCQNAVIICRLIKIRVSALFFVMYVCMCACIVAS